MEIAESFFAKQEGWMYQYSFECSGKNHLLGSLFLNNCEDDGFRHPQNQVLGWGLRRGAGLQTHQWALAKTVTEGTKFVPETATEAYRDRFPNKQKYIHENQSHRFSQLIFLYY